MNLLPEFSRSNLDANLRCSEIGNEVLERAIVQRETIGGRDRAFQLGFSRGSGSCSLTLGALAV